MADNHIIIDIPEAEVDFSSATWRSEVAKDFREIQNTLEPNPKPDNPTYYTWFWFFVRYGRALSSVEGQKYLHDKGLTNFTFVKDLLGLSMVAGGAYTIGYKFYTDCLKDRAKTDASGIKIKKEIAHPAGKGGLLSLFRKYITAIKTKPFLLLAGISGTGKSRIVRELARACWDEGTDEYKAQKPSNFEMVQVKPNWHDSSELIGYVSRVSGEAIYIAGDFLKFVAKAWENPDTPYFLCLDEMNLAPVEQYFAEYLSVVESRKVNEEGEVVTDPILKVEDEQWYYDLIGKLTQDGEVHDRFKTDGICIPQNLIVVGTVNMDETTFSFSRKVLDRAMTIEMNEVDLTGGLDDRHEKIGKLTTDSLVGKAVEGVDVYKAYKNVCDIAIDYLQTVNAKLEGTPFKIAYRTRNEFLLYVVNNLPYDKKEDGTDEDVNYIIARALDEITSMKILSRIEGDETKVKKLFNEDSLSRTIESALKEVYGDYKTDESISLAKLSEMKTRLENGYTSFWS